MSHFWERRLGTVRPLAGPSWLIALPRMTSRNVVAVRDGVAQALEHHCATAFPPRVAVGGDIEGLATTVRRQSADLATEYRRERRDHEVGPARGDHATLFESQTLTGKVHRGERRRASCVELHGRSVGSEYESQTSHRNALSVAHAGVGVEPLGIHPDDVSLVVVPAQAHEEARIASSDRISRLPGILEGLPNDFEQKALLRVEALCLTG